MTCPQCGDFLKPNAKSCRECGWEASGNPSGTVVPLHRGQPRGNARERGGHGSGTGGGTHWSPEVPHIRDMEWPTGDPETRWVIPPEIQERLDAIKANCVAPVSGRRVDPEAERRYLEKLERRKTASGADPERGA